MTGEPSSRGFTLTGIKHRACIFFFMSDFTLADLEAAMKFVADYEPNPLVAFAKKHGADLEEDLLVIPTFLLREFPELEKWKDTKGVKFSSHVDQCYIIKASMLIPSVKNFKPYAQS